MAITDRSSSRNGAKVIWVALHDTEGTSYTARQLRDATWWVGSSHAIADDKELLTPAQGCVPYDRASWTLRSGNARSVNIEQIGFAKWSRAEWLVHMPMLENTARWVRDMSAMFGIPIRYLSVDECRRNLPGVIEHNTYTQAFKDGTHWDCGPNYPEDVVLDLARAGVALKPKAPPMFGGDDDMIVLKGNNGPGPFGAQEVGILSGGIFVSLGNPDSDTRASIEEGHLRGSQSVLRVNEGAWGEMDVQSKQIRQVEGDGRTRLPDRAAPAA